MWPWKIRFSNYFPILKYIFITCSPPSLRPDNLDQTNESVPFQITWLPNVTFEKRNVSSKAIIRTLVDSNDSLWLGVWRNYGESMGKVWRKYGSSMAKSMVKVWRKYGKGMAEFAILWPIYGCHTFSEFRVWVWEQFAILWPHIWRSILWISNPDPNRVHRTWPLISRRSLELLIGNWHDYLENF